jgi:GntR family transcriptional regulator, transcriptional repressor for pyruvate dehydrogenase complex
MTRGWSPIRRRSPSQVGTNCTPIHTLTRSARTGHILFARARNLTETVTEGHAPLSKMTPDPAPSNMASARESSGSTSKSGVKRKPSYVHAADQIRVRILSGQLVPGERLPPENDLAAELNVSRTTAREALRLLASENLVETKRGVFGGVFIVHPTHQDIERSMDTAFSLMASSGELSIDEVIEAWLIVGPSVAGLAAQRRTDEEAVSLLALSEPLPESATDAECVATSIRFSHVLLQMTRNRLLPLLAGPLLRVLPGRLQSLRSEPGWWVRNAREYRRLAEAIQERDPQRAIEEMSNHVRKYQSKPSAD